MRIGIHLPQSGAVTTRADILDSARLVERLGFDSAWLFDHLVYPSAEGSQYPYGGHQLPFAPDDPILEALITAAVVAGATERVRLGVSVLVVPMRETLLLAKSVATLDVLSGGRMTLAAGVGWWREEFAAVGVPFSTRGRRIDEQLAAMRRLWAAGSAEFHGELVDFDPVSCFPLPVQPGGPPLLIGGYGPRAWQRTAAVGDGWQGVGASIDSLAEARRHILAAARSIDRDPATLLFSTSIGASHDPRRIRDALLRLAEAGFGQAVLNFGTVADKDRWQDALRDVAERALPEVVDVPPRL